MLAGLMMSSMGQASFEWGSYEGPEGSRRYKLYVPAASAAPRRLLVMLHGCTQDPDDFARGTRMNTVAGEKGFLVLYPEQPASANPLKCWNWFAAAHQKRESGEPAILAGIIRRVAAQHGVDPTRVYIAGISAGGAMTAIMGATYPELFSGMAIHSGIAYGLVSNASEALVAMRGPKGDTALLGEAVVKSMGERRKVLPVFVLQGEKDPSVVPANASLVAGQWRVVSGNAVRLQVIEGLAHAWSGGSKEGTYTDEKGPDASRAIVDFFLGLEPKEK